MKALLEPSVFRSLLLVQAAAFMLLALVLTAQAVSDFYKPGGGGLDSQLKLVAQAMAGGAALAPEPRSAEQAGRLVEGLFRRDASPEMAAQDLAWQIRDRSSVLAASPWPGPFGERLPAGVGIDRSAMLEGWLVIGGRSDDGQIISLIGLSPGYLAAVRRGIVKDFFISTALLLGTLVVGSVIATRIGLRPLRRFAQALAERTARDLAPVEDSRAPTELRPVVQAINQLLERLRAHRDAEQQFFADAAHELRTPLAVINAQAHELARADAGPQRAQALTALEAGVSRAARSLDKVLALARTGVQADAAPGMRALSLAPLVREAVRRHAQRALHSGHDLGLVACDEAAVVAQPDLLHAALDNLIDNALRHTPAGTAVDVLLQRTETLARVVVEDGGPGVPEAERERVFARFVRGSAAVGTDGSGLGLAVVADVARACGGQARAEASPALGGARFVLELPLAREARP